MSRENMVNTRLPDSEFAQVKEIVNDLGLSMYRVVRLAMIELLKLDREDLRTAARAVSDLAELRNYTPNEESRPEGNGTALEVAARKRRGREATRSSG